MFRFFIIFLIASSTIFANPIPIGSNNLDDLSDTDPDGLNESDDTANDKSWNSHDVNINSLKYPVFLTSSNVIVDSSVSSVADCPSDTSSAGSVDDKIEKRRKIECPVQEAPVRPGVTRPSKQPTTNNPKNTISSDELCTAELSYHVTCGGPEYITSALSKLPKPLIGFIPNCVLGKFLISSLIIICRADSS